MTWLKLSVMSHLQGSVDAAYWTVPTVLLVSTTITMPFPTAAKEGYFDDAERFRNEKSGVETLVCVFSRFLGTYKGFTLHVIALGSMYTWFTNICGLLWEKGYVGAKI